VYENGIKKHTRDKEISLHVIDYALSLYCALDERLKVKRKKGKKDD